MDIHRLFHSSAGNRCVSAGFAGQQGRQEVVAEVSTVLVGIWLHARSCRQRRSMSSSSLANRVPEVLHARKRIRERILVFVVVVNKLVYKLVVIVNAHCFVDKTGFLHNVNGLRSR